MSEHTFETSGLKAFETSEQAPGYGELLDEFRTHTTEWVQARRDDLLGEQRRLHVAELAAVCVLDERRVQCAPEPGLAHRALRDELEVARALETMPAIAEAASSGALSWDQLKGVVEAATPATDAEWAERAPHWAPADLVRQARAAEVVTGEDAAARREARELRWWDDAARGADAWDTLAHRGADAFVDLCQNYADVTPTRRHRPLIVMHTNGMSAEVDGIPIALETLDARRDEARVVEQRDDAAVVDFGTGRFAVPAELARIIEHRDLHCRYPGCERTWRLQNHHLTPVVWDGTTSRTTVVRLCALHHKRMEPHGTERLVGDPDRPDGLRLVRVGAAARAGPAP